MLSPTPLVYVLVIYPTFIPNIIHYLQSLLVAIHRSFHLLIPTMLSASSLVKRLKMPLMCQNFARHDQYILLYQKSKKSSQEHRNKGCNKAKMAFSLQEAERHTKTGQWGTGKGLFGQMRPKSIIWGQMEKKWVWKMPGEGLSDRLVQWMVKFGGGFLMIWGCMSWEGPGNLTQNDGRMDADLFMSILDDELQVSQEKAL